MSVLLRLSLSMLVGGYLGLERERKGRPAGFRTYMFVCLGATLTVLISQYECMMLNTFWIPRLHNQELKVDVSRIGAQVVNGIGFLGAGTIIVNARQEVKGLTTAAGLWASGGMGLALGAGFYECAIIGFLLIFFSTRFLENFESHLIRQGTNINVYLEFEHIENLKSIVQRLKQKNIRIYQVELDRSHGESDMGNMKAVLFLHLQHREDHTQILSELSDLEYVRLVNEI